MRSVDNHAGVARERCDARHFARPRPRPVNAENSMGFHAPQETMRLLGEAIDFARQGEVEAAKIQPVEKQPVKSGG